ncbi:hypothetical protein C8F04DRAFT_1195223 [Mycena alexandri]|uniref:Uncharacterized protein n=1 Tax=Mycena alexandri TaxID=1745969 RepID=A0AAD6WQQ1_9AGAR|nr:hypothetical protein C8F04DRAFT_1195223 [Mycena alexandri]
MSHDNHCRALQNQYSLHTGFRMQTSGCCIEACHFMTQSGHLKVLTNHENCPLVWTFLSLAQYFNVYTIRNIQKAALTSSREFNNQLRAPEVPLVARGTATPYGPGGGSATTISSGQPFAGRKQGSGTRDQIFGSQTYGSGYPGISGRGVADRGFPFFLWPLSFEGRPGNGAYLQSNFEYGHANSSRPGEATVTASFASAATAANISVFRILADDITTVSLLGNIFANCSRYTTSSADNLVFAAYNETGASLPQPEQVIQYYRASSIALSLDGYNNTSVFLADGTPDVSLPSSGIDTALLNCINQTIGLAAPLITSGGQWAAIPNNMGLLGLTLGPNEDVRKNTGNYKELHKIDSTETCIQSLIGREVRRDHRSEGRRGCVICEGVQQLFRTRSQDVGTVKARAVTTKTARERWWTTTGEAEDDEGHEGEYEGESEGDSEVQIRA